MSHQLSKVQVIAYTEAAAEYVTKTLRSHCPVHEKFVWPNVKPFHKYLIHFRDSNEIVDYDSMRIEEYTEEISCHSAFNFSATTLDLVRMEERDLNAWGFQRLLYFGAIIRDENGTEFRPSRFRQHLVNAYEVNCIKLA